ncbi:MAG: Maf family protein [Deltaproteobacteria bacterium]|nr:Maf family protein [Deltaproteobacteria bacterium]
MMATTTTPELILASASPRRRELLTAAGFEFTVQPADVDESALPLETPNDQVRRLALAKAQAVAQANPDKLVLAADTIVVLEGQIYGKPKDLTEAKTILQKLSGQTHQVITAFCLMGKNCPEPLERVVTSEVVFRPLSDREIDAYLRRGESLDKAGGYAVQGHGLSLIQETRGSLTNGMGLPLTEVIELLQSRLGPRA